MDKKEFYIKYPESEKVDNNSDIIRIAEEFAEYLRWKKEIDIVTKDIYDWLEIDYEKYQKEVDDM